jgi:hypothetical protein
MLDSSLISAFLIVGPVLMLLVVGLVITLASGEVTLWTRPGRREVLRNLSLMLVRLAGVGALLVALQRLGGLPITLSW